MAWSTREIAELAGTTVRAVRHYHQVGLLAEPERRTNGYKQYGVAHLVRVLRIKRLTDLGFSLAQIAEMGETDDHPAEELRALDADLAATIERLQRVRVELGQILRQSAPTDLPPDVAAAAAAAELTDTDRSLVVVMSRVLGPQGLQTYADMLQNLRGDPSQSAFDDLPADADEQSRDALAEHLAPYVRDLLADHPGLVDIDADAPGGTPFAQETATRAMRDLYNPAQLDVIRRTYALLRSSSPPEQV